MKVLIDGVAFQPGYFQRESFEERTGFWKKIIAAMDQSEDWDILLLDRGATPVFPGSTAIPFPSFSGRYFARDSLLIQKIADHYKAEVFISSGWTTPLCLPSLLVEQVAGCLHVPVEQELAKVFARRIISDRAVAVIEAHGPVVDRIRIDLLAIHQEHECSLHEAFFRRWSDLRSLQSRVEC